jgi:apolipoprotein N-acyltransferase
VNWLPFLQWFTPIVGGWTPGDKTVTFEIARDQNPAEEKTVTVGLNEPPPRKTIKTAALICFEDTFPGTAREASQDDLDFLINLTNDGWFGDSSEQWQHMANSVFRSVENGLPLIRCANNGVTCWIDGYGRVAQIFRDAHDSEYGPGFLTVEIPLLQSTQKSPPTFYNRHGDWFGWSCVWIAALMVGQKIIARKR